MDELIKEEEEELRREKLLESEDYNEETEDEDECWEEDEVGDDDAIYPEEGYEEEEEEEEEIEEEIEEKSKVNHNKKVTFADQVTESAKAHTIRSPADIYAHMLMKAKQSEKLADDTYVEKITPEDIDFISPSNKPEEKKRSSLFKSRRRSNLLHIPQETRKPVPIGGIKEDITAKSPKQNTNLPVKAVVVEKDVRPEDVDVEALEDEIWMKEVVVL